MGEASRATELDEAVASLQSGRGVLVIGVPGAGRTHFVHSVLDRLEPAISSGLGIGDDVEKLGAVQATKLAGAIRAGTILPLLTASARRPLTGPLEKLCRDGVVDRIHLSPLSPASLLWAVENFLGGPLDSSAVPAFVPRRAGGDLVVLQEIVREARASGVLVEDDGRWRLATMMPPRDGLRRLVLARVGPPEMVTATPLAETILDILGLAPQLSVRNLSLIVEQVVPEGAVGGVLEGLETEGVIEVVDRAGSLHLRIHDAVIEMVLPQTVGLLRGGRLANAIVDVLGSSPLSALSSEELVALARYALAQNRVIDADVLTRASRAALNSYQLQLALQVASAAVQYGGGIDAEIAFAAAESQLGRFVPAQARLARIRRAAGGMDGTGGDPVQIAAIEELAELVRERIDKPGVWTLPFDTTGDASLDPLSSLRFHALRDPGVPAGDRALPTSDPTGLEPLEGERLAHESSNAVLNGELGRAMALLDRGEAVLGPVGADMFRLHLGRSLIAGYDGGILLALETVTRLREQAAALGQPVQQAVCDWSIGALLNANGRFSEAIPPLRSAMELMQRIGMAPVARLAATDLVTALAVTGDTREAEQILLPLLQEPDDGFLLRGRSLQALGWLRAAQDRLADSADAFIRAADSHETLQHSLSSLLALVEAARAGRARAVLARVEALGQRVEGACLALAVRLARALARGEGPTSAEAVPEVPGLLDTDRDGLAAEFDAIGRQAVTLGLNLLAAEAFARACREYAEVGDERASAAAARCCDDCLVDCGPVSDPFLVTRSGTRLSDREREIAVQAAEGRTNREIAQELVLSVRTVETHLLRIYRRLGIRGRAQLAEALHLSPGSQHEVGNQPE